MGCQMKKLVLSISILFTLCVIVIFSTKFHYPKLPFPDKTKHEVAQLATSSDLPLSKVTQQNGYVWFVTDDSHKEALVSLKHRMTQNGWEFVDQHGSGYFFKKGNEKVLIESQQWTRNYLLFQLPIGL
jgi:hypothetical protein